MKIPPKPRSRLDQGPPEKSGVDGAATKERPIPDTLDPITSFAVKPVLNSDGPLSETATELKKVWRSGGKALSLGKAIDEITKPIYSGPPEQLPSGKRGPQSKRTQYDVATEHRERAIKILHKHHIAVPKARHESAATTRNLVSAAASEFAPITPQHNLARKVFEKLDQDGTPRDIKTVRETLKGLGFLPKKN